MVRFIDWVTHEEAQVLIGNADLLLLFAQNQPLQVPNKLYEYLGTRIPIFGFVDADGESAAILREAGGHVLVTDQNGPEVETLLERAINRAGDRETAEDSGILDALTTERQMDRLVTTVLRSRS